MYATIHDEMLSNIEHLDREIQGKIILAYVEYQLYGTTPDPSDVLVYSVFMAKKFDLDAIKNRADASRSNGTLWWAPRGNSNAGKTWEKVSKQPRGNLEQPRGNLEQPVGNLEQPIEREREWEIEWEIKNKNKKQKYMDFVFLTETEHTSLINKFWLTKTNYWIDRLNSYIGQIGVASASKKYKSHYFTILNRDRREWWKDSDGLAKEEALAKHREHLREQYLSSIESSDVWSEKKAEAFNRRWEVLGA